MRRPTLYRVACTRRETASESGEHGDLICNWVATTTAPPKLCALCGSGLHLVVEPVAIDPLARLVEGLEDATYVLQLSLDNTERRMIGDLWTGPTGSVMLLYRDAELLGAYKLVASSDAEALLAYLIDPCSGVVGVERVADRLEGES